MPAPRNPILIPEDTKESQHLLEDRFNVSEGSAAQLMSEIPAMINEIVKHFPKKISASPIPKKK
ncbi:MAG: hypothetical protein MUC95_05455 [Spirochaetes bacterium]|jgi:hypothetical protein|nr:hypothetical protein [Spirochaetota bacterium]